jgi:hypothetical protein
VPLTPAGRGAFVRRAGGAAAAAEEAAGAWGLPLRMDAAR